MFNESKYSILKPSLQRGITPKKKKSKSLLKNKQPNLITQIPSPFPYTNNFLTKTNFHQNSFTPTNRTNYINSQKLLPPQRKRNRKTLVLDLDETLVHSSFIPFEENDIILQVEFDNVLYNIYVLVRPNALQFLINMSKYFEIVIFTASLSKYANPLLDIIDPKKVCSYRLYRDHCTLINGIFVKELKRLNRNIKDIIIVDNSPTSYAFNPQNGIPIKSWFEDKNDNELEKLEPFLKFLSKVDDIKLYIPSIVKDNEIDYDEINNILMKDKENMKKDEEEKNNNNFDINSFNNLTSNLNNNLNHISELSERNEEEKQNLNNNNIKIDNDLKLDNINNNRKKNIKDQYSFRLGINTNILNNLNELNNNFKTGTLYDRFSPFLPLSLSKSTKNNVKIHSIQLINNKSKRTKINNIHPIKMKNFNENEKNLLPLMNKFNDQKTDSALSKSIKLKMSSSQTNYKTIFSFGTQSEEKKPKLIKENKIENDNFQRSNSTTLIKQDLQNQKITLKKALSKNFKTTRDFINTFKLTKNHIPLSTKNNNKKLKLGKDYFIKSKEIIYSNN